jgi:hypothetical protein
MAIQTPLVPFARYSAVNLRVESPRFSEARFSFNHHRLLEPDGYILPAQDKADYYRHPRLRREIAPATHSPAFGQHPPPSPTAKSQGDHAQVNTLVAKLTFARIYADHVLNQTERLA